MNLYKILFSHHTINNNNSGIKCLVLANNDDEIYEWLKNGQTLKDDFISLSWGHSEKYVPFFKQKILSKNGDYFNDDIQFIDTYYGITLYGWELKQL